MTTYVADGTTFERGDGASPEVFAVLAQLVSMGPVGQDRSLIDTTNLASVAREYKKAIKDGQEMSFVLQYDPQDTGQAALLTDLNSEDPVNYRVTFTDSPATTVTFAGLCTNWSIVDIEIDNVLGLNLTIKPTSDLVFG